MGAILNKVRNKYRALSTQKSQGYLANLQNEFGDDWGEQLEKFYRDLMQTMGHDFQFPNMANSAYRYFVLEHSKNTTPLGYDQKNESFVFEIANGHLLANHNHVTYQGNDFNIDVATKMAFLAIHDKDMLLEGITLEGDEYQKILLQLAIQRYCPEIKIHNEATEMGEEGQRALTEFQAYERTNPLDDSAPIQEMTSPAEPAPAPPPTQTERALAALKAQEAELEAKIRDEEKSAQQELLRQAKEAVALAEQHAEKEKRAREIAQAKAVTAEVKRQEAIAKARAAEILQQDAEIRAAASNLRADALFQEKVDKTTEDPSQPHPSDDFECLGEIPGFLRKSKTAPPDDGKTSTLKQTGTDQYGGTPKAPHA